MIFRLDFPAVNLSSGVSVIEVVTEALNQVIQSGVLDDLKLLDKRVCAIESDNIDAKNFVCPELPSSSSASITTPEDSLSPTVNQDAPSPTMIEGQASSAMIEGQSSSTMIEGQSSSVMVEGQASSVMIEGQASSDMAAPEATTVAQVSETPSSDFAMPGTPAMSATLDLPQATLSPSPVSADMVSTSVDASLESGSPYGKSFRTV